jgi:hypothetical protein
MKAYSGVHVKIHIFLTSVLTGGEWSASCPGCFTPEEEAPGIHWIGGWVDPRADLDNVENRKFLTLPELELRPLGRPARSQSLCRLRHPGSYLGTDGRILLVLNWILNKCGFWAPTGLNTFRIRSSSGIFLMRY